MNKELVEKMKSQMDKDIRNELAGVAAALSWVQSDLLRAKIKIAKVEILVEEYRAEKRYDVSDAIRNAISEPDIYSETKPNI
jgi:hypothetical protein